MVRFGTAGARQFGKMMLGEYGMMLELLVVKRQE